MMRAVTRGDTPWWPDRKWVFVSPPISIETDFTWEMPNYFGVDSRAIGLYPVSYTHLRAHETVLDLVCRLLLEKKKHHILYIVSTSNLVI